jgi:hypothetical protein
MPLQLSNDYKIGFIDGEGCFEIYAKDYKPQVFVMFQVSQTGEKGKPVLEAIRDFFQCGNVTILKKKGSRVTGTKYVRSSDHYGYQVYRIEDIIKVLIPFFDQNHLIIKNSDYKLWREAAFIIWKKKHTTHEGRKRMLELATELHNSR